MGRPKSWNSPTAAIRVPIHAIDAVMALAKQLDAEPPPQSFVQNPDRYLVTIGHGPDETRYLIQPPTDISSAEAALVDQLVDQFFEAHPSERDRLAAYCHLVEKTLTPVKV